MKNKKGLMGIVSLLAVSMALSLPARATDGSDAAFAKNLQSGLKAISAEALPLKASVQQTNQKAIYQKRINVALVQADSLGINHSQTGSKLLAVDTYSQLPLCEKNITTTEVSFSSLHQDTDYSCVSDFKKTGDGALCWQVCSKQCDGNGACWLSCTYHCVSQGGEGDPRKNG